MIPEYSLTRPFVPCAALIFLDPGHRSNTYCVREMGHSGKHNIVDEEPESAADRAVKAQVVVMETAAHSLTGQVKAVEALQIALREKE